MHLDFQYINGQLINQVDGSEITNNGVIHKNGGKGISAYYNTTSNILTTNKKYNVSSLSDISIFCYVKLLKDESYTRVIFGQYISGQPNRVALTSSSNENLSYFNNGVYVSAPSGTVTIGDWQLLGFTLAANGDVKVYHNNIMVTSGNNTSLWEDTEFTIGTAVSSLYINNIQIYTELATQDDINKIYSDFLNFKQASEKIIIPSKQRHRHKQLTTNRDGLVAEYLMTPSPGGIVVDTVSGNNVDITGSVTTYTGIKIISSVIARAFSSTINIGTQNTINFVIKGGVGILCTNSGITSYIAYLYSTKIDYRISGETYSFITTLATSITYIISLVRDNTNVSLFINGAFIEAHTFTNNDAVILNTFAYALNGTFENVQIYNRAQTEQEILQYYNSFRQLIYRNEFKYLGDGNPTTIRTLGTGTYKIGTYNITEEDSLLGIKKGDNYYECTSAGTEATLSDWNSGEIEFNLYKYQTSNLYVFPFISDRVPSSYSAYIGYDFYSDNSNRLGLAKNNGTSRTTIFYTATSYIQGSTEYCAKIIRLKSAGKLPLCGDTIYPAWTFAIYIKGGAFGATYQLVDVTGGSGTNPVTDSTYTTSKYMAKDFDLGDRISNIKIWNQNYVE